ncbi:MAG TPA: phosphoribosylaminoimidazolesuccinocarboxamide synthase [Acidiferrobacteraceae bacterium]|nr:phosphoribosylaminoimidazolesuccinocarboxamide synthase [Acidiferrobacteraceae bacterium]HEX19633.1 phosphoribosylaminoimidazolesuccinocarboxamide synthase [Acidiferrobacteraceae bacterium]
MVEALLDSDLGSLRLLNRGKVRDIYEIDDHHLLMVTTDRISAFDVVLPTAIPGKGAALTAISHFWFQRMQDIIPNHLSGLSLEAVLPDEAERARVADCAMVVKRLKPLPVEAIVRGYLVGSGWKDYQNSGQVCGIDLPPGLQLADQLPQAIYTPSTKAEVGEHDVNIDFDRTVELLGADLAAQVRDKSLEIYTQARDYAATHGIIIADTKFEFGLDKDKALVLIDEVLTPDSSRFWPTNEYEVGKNPPSYDKQYVRDYLETLDWDKKAPGPKLPAEVVQKTMEKYNEALARLTK